MMGLHRLINWFGRQFWWLQKGLFGIFVLQAVWQLVPDVITGSSLRDEISKILQLTIWWLCVSALITLIWALARVAFNLDLWLYYSVWTNHIAHLLYRKTSPKYRHASYIRRSVVLQGSKKRPVFIRREHLMRRRYWPNWVFSIVTILDPSKIGQRIETLDPQERKRWVLEVDLRDESFGIYNNAGKRFLARCFGASARSEQAFEQSARFQSFLQPSTLAGSSIKWGEIGESIPIRWASGGYLPIVRYQGKYWALLFFRDIFPIGLNVANGASENKSEYKDLHRLIIREFSEETILLATRPHRQGRMVHKTFFVYTLDPLAESDMADYVNPEFIAKQADLRERHDDIQFRTRPGYTRELRSIDTPFVVRVTYHLPDLKTAETKEIHNVVYSLNPAEFGIEVIWLCTFALQEGEYLVDGEYDLGRDVLIRRPIVLLNMEYLERVYERDGTLGSMSDHPDSAECKILPLVSEKDCIVFDIDIDLRRDRLQAIAQELSKPHLSSKYKRNLEWESNLIKSWLSEYEQAFQKIGAKGLEDERLRTLCPVTWKTLELMLEHQLNYRV